MENFNEKQFKRYLLKENLLWNNPVVAFNMLGPCSIPGALYNAYQIGKNLFQTSGENKAKCLIFDEPITEWQNLVLGVKGRIARFFTQKGVRVDYKHNARSQDLREVLADNDFQNIVLMGHGGRDNWIARDGKIHTNDVDEWMAGLPLKQGYFIQFTCGDRRGRPLGYSAVEDKTKILGYTKNMNLGDRFKSLWEGSQDIGTLENISQ